MFEWGTSFSRELRGTSDANRCTGPFPGGPQEQMSDGWWADKWMLWAASGWESVFSLVIPAWIPLPREQSCAHHDCMCTC